MSEPILRLHRDIFPRTDHGYTWVECMWVEKDNDRVSCIWPAAGCNERLGTMPGGPMPPAIDEIKYQAERHGFDPYRVRTVKSETTHDEFHYVYSTCITKTPF